MAELFAPLRNGGYALFGDAAYIYDQGVEHVSGETGRRGHYVVQSRGVCGLKRSIFRDSRFHVEGNGFRASGPGFDSRAKVLQIGDRNKSLQLTRLGGEATVWGMREVELGERSAARAGDRLEECIRHAAAPRDVEPFEVCEFCELHQALCAQLC